MSLHALIRAITTSPFNNYYLASACGKAESTVRRYRRLLKEKELSWDQLKDLGDT